MSTKFSPDVVARLLDGLANDDAFRALFESDPREALRSIGHETKPQHLGVEGKDPVLPFLKFQGGLASKESIASDADRLASSYLSTDETQVAGRIFGPFDFCSG